MIIIKWFKKLFGLNKPIIVGGKTLTEVIQENLNKRKTLSNDATEEIDI
jgi:hypothetical protein